MDGSRGDVRSDRAVTQAASPSEASPSGTRTPGYLQLLSSPWMLPVILLITFGVFAPTLNTWFWADDFSLLRSSQTTPLGAFIVDEFDYRNVEPPLPFYRPLYFISFRLCYAAFGQHALPYHALNLTLHLGSVVLVWLIARRLLQSGFGANVAALIFALHPAYTESVQFIARGNTLMVTFVYLLTLLAFMNYAEGGKQRHFYYIASVVGFAAAMLYHSTALSLIAVLTAYVFLVARTPSEILRPRWWLRFSPFVAIAIVMLVIQTRPEVGLTRYVRIGWHQYSELGQYLGYALVPIFSTDWLRLDLPRLRLLTYLSIAGSLVMIGATLFLLDRRQWPYRGVFVALWLYASLAPNTTQLVVPTPALLYLPGVSLALFLVLVTRQVNEMLPPDLLRRAAPLAPLVLVILVAGSIALGHAHQRNLTTKDNRAFITQLRASVPSVPPGSKLYIVNPPLNLAIFDAAWLEPAVQLYYGDVTVQHISAEQAATIRAAEPAALIFENRP